jgi:hypothetical protein
MRLRRIIYCSSEFEKKVRREMRIPSFDVFCSGDDTEILGGGRELCI